MEKENKLNIKELVSLPITTYNDFYNVVSKNLKKFEQIKLIILLMQANHDLFISDNIEKIISQPQLSFESFYNNLQNKLSITEQKELLKILNVLSLLNNTSKNGSNPIVREKTMHKKDNVL